jgi:hypothetical protein
LNPIQAFYQAELRPDLSEHCLFVKNREKQLAITLSATCRRCDRSTKFATANPSFGGLNYGPLRRILLPFLAVRQTFRLRQMTAVTRKRNCVARIGLIVCLNAITDARAETHSGTKLNETASTFAMELIKQGDVIADGQGAWTEHRPSAGEENEFIRVHGFAEYAKWHLGIDRRFSETSKRRYKFPYGDFKKVHRCGLLAVKARARQYGYTEIENAAAELDRAIKRSADAMEHRPPGLCAQRSRTPLKFEQRVSNPLAAQAISLCSGIIHLNPNR